MSKDYKTNSKNNKNEINEYISKAKQYSQNNYHALALEFLLKSINLLKQSSITDKNESYQKKLEHSYKLYCYHANALRKYELTIQLVKDNFIEDLIFFFDWSFFYCEALLNLHKYDEYEQTILKLKSIDSEYGDDCLIKEVLLTIEGEKYFLQKDYIKAISFYEQADKNVFFTENNRIFYYKYALACYKMQNYEKAILLLDAVIRSDLYFYDAYILKLKIFIKQQNYSKLLALTNYLEKFFMNLKLSIHVYLYMMYVYALVQLKEFSQYNNFKLKYVSATKYLTDENCIQNISIKLLNKAYILFFIMNSEINGYNKNNLIIYPKHIHSQSQKAIVFDGILNNEEVAIKKYDFNLQLKKDNEYAFNNILQNVLKEVLTLEKLRKLRNTSSILLMSIKCTFLLNKKQFLYIVSPLFKGISLYDILHIKKITINSKNKLKIICQIADAIQFLHNNQIYYLNINSQNILLAYNENTINFDKIMLTGFSKVNLNKIDIEMLDMYSAPEFFYEKPYISQYADVYSFGILLCEILMEEKLFCDLDKDELIRRKYEGYIPNFEIFERDFLLRKNKNKLISVIMECLEIDYQKRIDINHVINELRSLSF